MAVEWSFLIGLLATLVDTSDMPLFYLKIKLPSLIFAIPRGISMDLPIALGDMRRQRTDTVFHVIIVYGKVHADEWYPLSRMWRKLATARVLQRLDLISVRVGAATRQSFAA